MTKKLNILKLISLILGFLQIASIVFLSLCFGLNVTWALEAFSITVIMSVLGAFVIVDLLFVLLLIIVISSTRVHNNLKVMRSMGNDIEKVFEFGGIGIVVVDENNLIIWTSDLFIERHITVLDNSIFDWQPQLRIFEDPNIQNANPKIIINGRDYLVSHVKETGVYIFKDVSDFEAAYKFAKDQSLVIGTISIDNYDELEKKEEDDNTLMLKMREKMQDFSRDYGVLLKKVRNDSYFLISNYKSFASMQQDGFPILEHIRALGEMNKVSIALSGGISSGFPDVDSLNIEAAKALDIAMARGGDQIVVNQRGRELEIFGAQSEAIEKRSKVKVRILSDSLLNLMKDSPNTLIVGHADMDMDCAGGALGIWAMATKNGCTAHIVYDQRSIEKKTRQALRSTFTREEMKEMTLDPSEAFSRIKSKTLVILVDLHNPDISIAPKLFTKAKKVAIVDHHRRTSEDVVETFYQYLEPSASSASELVTELIHFASVSSRFELDSRIATIMLSGIILDTRAFKTKTTGTRTFEASMILKEYGADVAKANLFLEDDFDEFLLINSILSTLKTPFPGVVVCTAKEGILERAVLSKVANRCLELKDVRAAFVIGQTSNKEIRISARSDSSINVHVIMEKLNGGGHLASAAATISDSNLIAVERSLIKVIDERIQDALIKE